VVPGPVTFTNITPRPRDRADTGVLVCEAGSTICNSVLFVLNSAHSLGELNAGNPACELTDWNPSLATATCGPSSIPQGCARLRDSATTCPDAITVDPGSLPSSAMPSQFRWRKPAPCSPSVVPLSAPPIAASNAGRLV